MNRSEETVDQRIPAYLVEIIENLLYCLSLSQQNEMSFPPSLLAQERAFIRKRAKQLGYNCITKRDIGLSQCILYVYKKKLLEEFTVTYPIIITHEVLSKILFTLEKYPISSSEFRVFISSRDYEDFIGQEGETKLNRDLKELDWGYSVLPSQTTKLTKFNPAMNEHRNKSLPIFNYKHLILNYLSDHEVLIIHGGVASGKSTQVPQFLMEKCFEANVGYKIFLCEPFRITTVAVAERIAYERREEIGQSVGYQIPLETKKSATSIVICITPDVLLKMLISREQVFQGKVIVILDEFEENNYLTEFLLIGFKDLFKVNSFLRLIIMTNASDVKSLYTYFSCPKTIYDTSIRTATITMSSNLIPIQEYSLEDILMRTNYLNKCPVKNDINHVQGKTESSANNILELNTTEVIDVAMEKTWNTGDNDVFTFLINMIKKNVISVNYQLKSTGITLLMAACLYGKIKYVFELLKSGADTTIRCHDGYTAIDLASKKNYATIVELLKHYLIRNNGNVVSDREFIKLTASANVNEHTNRLITYYENFYPEHGIDLELLYTTVLHIHALSKPGAIMVFLPSFFDILSFRDVLFERESQLVTSGGSFTLRFLYSNMQTSEQKLIFQVPPADCRKIILSTNEGAVSLTISDLVYVIDTGKIEQKMYMSSTGKLSFITGWITSSQAQQRATKVGRLNPGCCYRLYSQLMPLPERNPMANFYTCSPQILCLYTKQMVSNEISVNSYLQRGLTVPEDFSLKPSIDILKSIDAFDICRNYEYLTELGKIMLQLPLEPQYAKMVLYAVALKCLDPILTIAAFSKHKSIFTLEEKYKMKSHIAAKEWKKIASEHFSDHLILIKLFLGRQSAGIEKRDKEYCEEFCISQSTLELVNTTRSNIVGHLRAMGIVKTRGVSDMRDLNSNSKEWVFVKAALVGGLYPNLVFVDRSSNELLCNKTGNKILLHPLSTLLDYSALPSKQTVMLSQQDIVDNLPTDWLVCNEVNNSLNNAYTASICTAVSPIMLALFAGSYKICAAFENQKTVLLLPNNKNDTEGSDSESEEDTSHSRIFMVDPHLKFKLDNDSAKSALYLRIKWFSYFLRCLKSPSKIMSTEEKQVLETIATVLKNEEKSKFPAGDPDFIGYKPTSYTIDLFQQPVHNKALTEVSVPNSPSMSSGLITKNSRYFLIRSYECNNLAASMLSGFWRFEPATEVKLIHALNSGAEVKLIFQFTGTDCFQGLAALISDQFSNRKQNCLFIRWLKEGLVRMTAVKEYIGADTCHKLTILEDGTEIDRSLASILMMMWNMPHMLLRSNIQI